MKIYLFVSTLLLILMQVEKTSLAQTSPQIVCVPDWVHSQLLTKRCAKENRKTKNHSCQKNEKAIQLKDECIQNYERIKSTVCLPPSLVTGFQLWSFTDYQTRCDSTTGVNSWSDADSHCEPGKTRFEVSKNTPEICKKLTKLTDETHCESLELGEKLTSFCPVQTHHTKSCLDQSQIWVSVSSQPTVSCKEAIDLSKKVRCLTQEQGFFWKTSCANDPRRRPDLDQAFCQGNEAVLSEELAASLPLCNSLATQEMETQCVSIAAKEKLKSNCPYTMQNYATCAPDEFLLVAPNNSACTTQAHEEKKVDRLIDQNCDLTSAFPHEFENIRLVFSALVEKQTDKNIENFDQLNETLKIINQIETLSSSQKARLRSIFLKQFFNKINSNKKWDHLNTIKKILENEPDWHTRAQILNEYVIATGNSRHQLDRIQNELLLEKESKPNSRVAQYCAPATRNACNYILELMTFTYPLSLECVKSIDKGTLIAQCEIEKKQVKRIATKDKSALTRNFSGFYGRLETFLRSQGALIYCGGDHCAMFVIEEEKIFIYDGTITEKVEKNKYIRRTLVENLSGVSKFHFDNLHLRATRLYVRKPDVRTPD